MWDPSACKVISGAMTEATRADIQNPRLGKDFRSVRGVSRRPHERGTMEEHRKHPPDPQYAEQEFPHRDRLPPAVEHNWSTRCAVMQRSAKILEMQARHYEHPTRSVDPLPWGRDGGAVLDGVPSQMGLSQAGECNARGARLIRLSPDGIDGPTSPLRAPCCSSPRRQSSGCSTTPANPKRSDTSKPAKSRAPARMRPRRARAYCAGGREPALTGSGRRHGRRRGRRVPVRRARRSVSVGS